MNNLTDRAFWQEYWKNYKYERVPARSEFESYFPADIYPGNGRTSIEIGGFPGTMSLYFARRGYRPTLLDFYVDPAIIKRLEKENGFGDNVIEAVEHDFFTYHTDRRWDLVFSIGFIEHFDDTADVIRRHVELVKEGGTLLIVLPNFRGINGWVQRTFDRHNYDAHNISSMIPSRLRSILATMPLHDVRVTYTRKPMVWLEPKPGLRNRVARSLVRGLSYMLKLLPVKSRLLSPYIVITAVRDNEIE